MKVYIDIFFFVNFLMNLQVFQILNYWRKRPAITGRSVAGAVLGALLGVLVVMLGIRTRWILWILIYVAGTSFLIRFVYGKMNVRGYIRCVIGFYLTAAAVSGTLFGIRELLGLHSISLVFLLGGSMGIQLAAGAIRRMSENRMPEQYMYETWLEWRGKRIQGTGFFDTGNRLAEPISGAGVSIVTKELFQKLLTQEEKMELSEALSEGMINNRGTLLLRYIPYHSVGEERGFLPGILVDRMEIRLPDGKRISKDREWLGIYDKCLSNDAGFDILFHSGIFKQNVTLQDPVYGKQPE